MATVRITKELTEDVRAIARRKFDNRIKAAEASAPTTSKWGDYIYETLFKDHIHIMEQLPKNYFKSKNNVGIRRVGGESCHLNIDFSRARPWPYTVPDNDLVASHHYGDDLSLTDNLAWGEFYAEVKAWKSRVDTARKEAMDFVEGVDKILSSFSTLSPALKAWPPLWELLPERTKNKHKEIVERKKPEREAPSVDINRLTAVMAASKLGGL